MYSSIPSHSKHKKFPIAPSSSFDFSSFPFPPPIPSYSNNIKSSSGEEGEEAMDSLLSPSRPSSLSLSSRSHYPSQERGREEEEDDERRESIQLSTIDIGIGRDGDMAVERKNNPFNSKNREEEEHALLVERRRRKKGKGKGRMEEEEEEGEGEGVVYESSSAPSSYPSLFGCCSPSSLYSSIKSFFLSSSSSSVSRTIIFSSSSSTASVLPSVPYPPNIVCHQKYSLFSFLPLFLYNEFKFFFNFYFLLVALSQFIPILRVGFLFTYIGPLVFVLCISSIREAADDFARYRRDLEANSSPYTVLLPSGAYVSTTSSALRVGDLIRLNVNDRVPADCVLLRTNEPSGSIFLRTDQLDGETDWKPRNSVKTTQNMGEDRDIFLGAQGKGKGKGNIDNIHINIEPPKKSIYSFAGNVEVEGTDEGPSSSVPVSLEPLGLEQTLWSNTVIASIGPGSTGLLCLIIYTGRDTRSALNQDGPRSKVGKTDEELNEISKILFILTIILAFILTILKGFEGLWFIYFFRFILLFASIIPISLRVNLDLSKTFYSKEIEKDDLIPETIVRTSTIPEELGRISYLFADKTGTLTRNIMAAKVIQTHPNNIFSYKQFDYLKHIVSEHMKVSQPHTHNTSSSLSPSAALSPSMASVSHSYSTHTHRASSMTSRKGRSSPLPPHSHQRSHPRRVFDEGIEREEGEEKGEDGEDIHPYSPSLSSISETLQLLFGLALCHNVTPLKEDSPPSSSSLSPPSSSPSPSITYQAASPDEVALVKFAASVGVHLSSRSSTHISLSFDSVPHTEEYRIIHLFPFSSETKRMGIVLDHVSTGDIYFYLKGAESVMKNKILRSEWLQEEIDNLSRIGLRTLVFARKRLNPMEYKDFSNKLSIAASSVRDREHSLLHALQSLEYDLELLGITGVEDKLQPHVESTLETCRNAGIKCAMLTGDQATTAICIGISARLIDRSSSIFVFTPSSSPNEILKQLDTFSAKYNCVPVIDGQSLQVCLDYYSSQLAEALSHAPSLICCRCSPTQKAEIVKLIKSYTGLRVAAIGDGGNDVALITAADVGLGIVGLEGKQASLAADYSLTQFSHLTRLFLVHGQNSYKRTARLSQFVIHRGVIISIIQAVFSGLFFYLTVPIFNGWLMVGYATYYTMLPVFSLILDKEIDEDKVFLYPEFYSQSLAPMHKPLSHKTFAHCMFLSVYQGGMIMVLAIWLFESNFVHVVSISFTSLIFVELLNVAFLIHRWHWLMVTSLLLSLGAYLLSIFALKSYFDITFILSTQFVWKVSVITALACLPPALLTHIQHQLNPPATAKVT